MHRTIYVLNKKSGQFGIPAKVHIQNPLAKFKNDDKNTKHSHEQERLLKGDTVNSL